MLSYCSLNNEPLFVVVPNGPIIPSVPTVLLYRPCQRSYYTVRANGPMTPSVPTVLWHRPCQRQRKTGGALRVRVVRVYNTVSLTREGPCLSKRTTILWKFSSCFFLDFQMNERKKTKSWKLHTPYKGSRGGRETKKIMDSSNFPLSPPHFSVIFLAFIWKSRRQKKSGLFFFFFAKSWLKKNRLQCPLERQPLLHRKWSYPYLIGFFREHCNQDQICCVNMGENITFRSILGSD